MYLLTMWVCNCTQMDLQKLLDFIASDQENSPQEAILELPDATEEATSSTTSSATSSDSESDSESDGGISHISESSLDPGTPELRGDEEIGPDDNVADKGGSSPELTAQQAQPAHSSDKSDNESQAQPSVSLLTRFALSDSGF